jgi:ubiquinone/menaquinone biosynthesis C-methylase UbiE
LSEQRGTAADPFGGRHPTSHERLTGLPWDASYHDGPAPWDVSQPQPAVVRLASQGGFTGAVLDAGCGTGENALHIASLGSRVLGVDVAGTAVAMARAKAAERGVEAEFAVADAFELERLGRRFETVLDCGLFHVLSDEDRKKYAKNVSRAVKNRGALHILCFSTEEKGDEGPRRVGERELIELFNMKGWLVEEVSEARFETTIHPDGARAWLATFTRIKND